MLINRISNSFAKINFTNLKSQPKRQALSFGNKLQADSFESSDNSRVPTHAEFVAMDRELKDISPELQKEITEATQNAQKEVTEMCQKIQKTIQEVSDLYNAIQRGDYQGTAKLMDDTLEEFDENGNITRRSVFKRGKIQNSIEYDGEKINEIYNCQIQPINYRLNIQKSPDVISKSDVDLFWFTSTDTIFYHKDNVSFPDYSRKTGLEIVFENGKPTYLQKEYVTKSSGLAESETEVGFLDGKWQEIGD